MFTAPAELYDAIYFSFKDYAAEAAAIAQRIRTEHPAARAVLDVGSGTGEHAQRLASEHGFLVDGLDINEDFLRLARTKHPTGRFYFGDMTEFSIGRRYDSVICMFSSIGNVKTLPALERALHCFAKHVTSDGVVIVEPWFPPGTLSTGYQSERFGEAAGVRVHRRQTTVIEGRLCELRFDYTVERGSEVQQISEVHELGLFTEDETMAAFAAAGLTAQHEAASAGNRGHYIARITA